MLFSSHGTLRNTVVYLVNKAPAGHTHAELQDRLRLRVYDTLHDLVAAREIACADIERLYLYVSAEQKTAEAQIAARQRLNAEPPRPGPLPDAGRRHRGTAGGDSFSQTGYWGSRGADAGARESDHSGTDRGGVGPLRAG